MGRKKGLVAGFLSAAEKTSEKSEMEISEYSENRLSEQVETEDRQKLSKEYNKEDNEKATKPDSQKIRTSDKLVKRKKWSFKGFYISPENNLRLKELELVFLKMGERKDISDIINQAIEELYHRVCEADK